MNRKDSIPESLAGETRSRDQIIIRTSFVGIAANLLLAAFKAAVGIVSHSIAVTLDAVNNLSDALSSVITIVGTKLANRQPDRKHPLGHGRVEYLSAMIVAAIVLYAGITAAVASVKKIIRPEKAEYTAVSLMIIAVAIGVKLLLGRFVTAQGRRANSRAMEASGADATFDAILSASVLASALIYVVSGVSLEAWVGAAISIFIIRSGIGMMTDTLDDILGQRADPELTGKIRRILTEAPDVRGAYDLFLNNYGPDRNYASVHLELPDTMTVEEVDILTRNVQARVYQETGVVLTGVGVYSYNTKNSEAARIRNAVQALVLSHEWALQMHGFYIDTAEKDLRFDVVMSFEIGQEEGLAILTKELKEHYPEYRIQIAPDVDIAD